MPESLLTDTATFPTPRTTAINWRLSECANHISTCKLQLFIDLLGQQLPKEHPDKVIGLATIFLEQLQNMHGEDKIVLASAGRQAFLKCLPHVVKDVAEAIAIVQELDERTVTPKSGDENNAGAEHLRQTEDSYRQAQVMARVGNWIWDVKENRISWTEELYRIYGLEQSEEPMTYERFLSVLSPEDGAMLQEKVNRCLTEHVPYEVMQKLTLPNGTVKYVHSMGDVFKDADGNVIKLMGTSQDITERKAFEEKLRTYQEFTHKLMDVSPSAITSYDVRTGQYTFINKGVEKLLGYSIEEPMQKGVAFFMELVHPDDLPGLIEKNTAAMQDAATSPATDNEVIVEFKYRMRHKNGSYRWFHTYATVFDRDESGLLSHVLNVSVDITQQEESEQAISRKNLELQQSNTSLEEYAYIASHDLKEPLRKISMFADRLAAANKGNFAGNSEECLHKIVHAAGRMQTMINDLLTVSTISGNKDFETYNLEDILAEVRQNLEAKITQSGASIICDALPEHTVVPSQFRQLFQNLISNGIKFAKEGIAPSIHIKHRYISQNQLSRPHPFKAPQYLELTFADKGIGFDNEYATDIFNMFKRLHGRSAYEGSGIGLAICKKVVENHNGTIRAEGAPDGGARFIVTLPIL